MKQQWRDWPGECGNCGGAVEIFTDLLEEGWAVDGDELRCANCGAKGYIGIDRDITENWEGRDYE